MNEQVVGANSLPKRRSRAVEFFNRLWKENKLGFFGGIIVVLLLFVGIFAPLISKEKPTVNSPAYNIIHLVDRYESPSLIYWLGTDSLGRDVFSRMVYGAQISMIIGLGASAIATVLAAFIGIISGFLGGKFDLFVQRIVDAWLCFPSLIILLTAMALTGPGIVQVTMVLGISAGIGGSRLIRSGAISLRSNAYVDAATSTGATPTYVIMRHLLPNLLPLLIIFFTVGMAGMILGEAALSFLGFGVPPPQPSWGGMLSEGRAPMLQAPWLALWPGLALTVVVYGVNMFGDAVRDLLDPRLRGGGRFGALNIKKLAFKDDENDRVSL